MSRDMAEGEVGDSKRLGRLIAVLESYRRLDPPNALGSLAAFLQVCENEGASMNAVARLTGLRLATASRAVRALASRDQAGALPPYVGLIAIYQDPDDDRGRLVYLTDHGRELRDAWLKALS